MRHSWRNKTTISLGASAVALLALGVAVALAATSSVTVTGNNLQCTQGTTTAVCASTVSVPDGQSVTIRSPSVQPASLVPDPSFETVPFPANWKIFNSYTLAQVLVSNAPNGQYVAQDSFNGTSNWYGMDYTPAVTNATAGDTYSLSAYVEAANSGTVGKPTQIAIRERTPAGTDVASGVTNFTPTSTFQKVSASYTVHATGDTLDAYVLQNSAVAGNSLYVDDFILSVSSPVTTTTSTTTTTPPPTPTATVSAVPDGPTAPSGGWAVAYADAFGDCLVQTATGCTTGASHSDNTLYAIDNNALPANTNEPTRMNARQAVVDSNGLELNCNYAPGIASNANYNCATVVSQGVNGGSIPSTGYHGFTWSPGQGQTWVYQIVAKAPPDTNEMDPGFWSASTSWQWEIDMPEMWGYDKPGGVNVPSGWCQHSMGFPAIPRTNGSGSAHGEGDMQFCSSGNMGDPAAAYHTYTVEQANQTFFAWVDGTPVKWWNRTGATSFCVCGTWSPLRGGLIVQNSLRNYNLTNNTSFTSGTRTYSIRSIAVYEAASAGGANTTNSGVAPGTSVH